MDELFVTLKSKMVTALLSKVISKMMSKKLGCKINCHTNNIEAQLVDNKIEISAIIRLDADKKDFINCISRLI